MNALKSSIIRKSGLSSSITSATTIDNPPKPKKYVKSFDEGDILSHSLALTDHIHGLYAIELWRYDESNGKLVNVSLSHDEEAGSNGCGLLIKRITQEADPSNAYSTKEAVDAYEKLTDRSSPGFLPPSSLDVGVGLPGVLWAEAPSSKGMNNTQQRTSIGSRQRTSIVGSSRNLIESGPKDSVAWRDVEELANDPDQPFDERLQSFAKAGFKLATGVTYDSNGYRGIVIFFACPHGNAEKLNNSTNIMFMHNSAQMIGSSVAIQAQLDDIKAYRNKIRYDNWRITKIKVKTIVRFGGTLRKDAPEVNGLQNGTDKLKGGVSTLEKIRDVSFRLRTNAKEVAIEAKETARTKGSRYLKKLQGGSAGIPPSFTNSQAMLTFIGVFITHLTLSRLNLLIQTESSNELSLVLAPLGAFTTLQYCLTAAPASQPRNAFFAQIFAVTTALLLCYIPGMSPWFRSALTPAIVIPLMARFGIIHPPAGAACVVFSSGKYGWEHMGIFLSGVSIAITTAVLINNLSDKRQYPTSWYLIRKAKSSCSPTVQ